MAPKPFQSTAKRLFKGLVILEVVGVIGAYGLFHKMNTSQGTSKALFKNLNQRQ